MAETKKKNNNTKATSNKKSNNAKKNTTKKTKTQKNTTTKKTNTQKKNTTTKKSNTVNKNTTKKSTSSNKKPNNTKKGNNTKVTKKISTPTIDKKEEVIASEENLVIVSQEIHEDEKNEEVIVESVSNIEEVKENEALIKEDKKNNKDLITNIGIALVLFGLLLLVVTVYASTSFNLSYNISNVIIIISFIFELIGFGVIVYGLFKK